MKLRIATIALCAAFLLAAAPRAFAQAVAPSQPASASATAAASAAKKLPAPKPPPPPAALLPSVVRLKVTGDFVQPSLYAPLVAELIRKATMDRRPDTSIKVEEKKFFAKPKIIPRGRTSYALFPASAWAPNSKTVRRHVIAIIENVDVQGFGEPGRIFVSNSPESIVRTGELLTGRFARGESVRFMIHHLNKMYEAVRMVFQIKNTGSETAYVHIGVPTALYTSKDEMNAGHIATVNFMKQNAIGLGYIVEIPPGGTYQVRRLMLEPKIVASGLFDMRALRGGPIEFRIRALDRTAPENQIYDDIANYSTKRAHGVFESPVIETYEDYIVGDRWKFLNIGDDPVAADDGRDAALTGNYGVTYMINVTAVNPHETAERVHLDFAPGGGPAIGSVFVNDRFYDVKMTKPPNATQIISFIMQPGEKKNLRIVTIPEAGSNYPVRLIIRSRKVK